MSEPVEVRETEVRKSSTRRSRIVKVSLLAILLFAGLLVWRVRGSSEQPKYAQATVERGDIVKTITATGKLQAVVTVQVGSQVSGRIAEIYADFNNHVKKGQVIAKLEGEDAAALGNPLG